MQKIYPVSRFRIVWGDENSTPAEWELEYSSDMNEWQTFVKSTSSDIDWYSRWPGYEHYLAEPVKARYLRYRPINDPNPAIKIRLISAYR